MDVKCMLKMNRMERKNLRSMKTGRKVSRTWSLSWNMRCCLCLIPSFIGSIIFFFWPYIRVLCYSVIDNQFHKKFVGLYNYTETLLNPYFQLAVKNSLLLMIIGVPVLVLSALVLSMLLAFQLHKLPRIRDAFILPMLIPTASIVMIWQSIFSGVTSAVPIYLLYLWKNMGICVILLTAALTTIDWSLYEAAKLDGAKVIYLHRKITIPIITPAIFFVILLAIVNSFMIFKESYLYYGNKYPPDHSYTLQFYMNNNFLKFDYQALASSSILTSLLILLIVGIGLQIQRRYQS